MKLAGSEAAFTHGALKVTSNWNMESSVLHSACWGHNTGRHADARWRAATAAQHCPDVLGAGATHVNVPWPAGAQPVEDSRCVAHMCPQDPSTGIVLAAKPVRQLKPLQMRCQAEGSALQQHNTTTQKWTALQEVHTCLPLQVRCQVEGSEPKYLTLTGACAAPRAEGAPIEFRTSVRGSATQELTLTNPSVTAWQLAPVVHNDTWSGPELLAVPAGGSARYPVTYRPLAMATADKPHEGSVFFPIPDGTAVQFSLRGIADDPQPTDTINRQVGFRS